MKTIRTYRCEFCGTASQTYTSKYLCHLHESQCSKNPSLRACRSCAYLAFGFVLHPQHPGFSYRGPSCRAGGKLHDGVELCRNWAPEGGEK